MTFLSPATIIFFLPQKEGVCSKGKMRLATLLVLVFRSFYQRSILDRKSNKRRFFPDGNNVINGVSVTIYENLSATLQLLIR